MCEGTKENIINQYEPLFAMIHGTDSLIWDGVKLILMATA